MNLIDLGDDIFLLLLQLVQLLGLLKQAPDVCCGASRAAAPAARHRRRHLRPRPALDSEEDPAHERRGIEWVAGRGLEFGRVGQEQRGRDNRKGVAFSHGVG